MDNHAQTRAGTDKPGPSRQNMGELIHYRCPICDDRGDPVAESQGKARMVCTTDGCRVLQYKPYYA